MKIKRFDDIYESKEKNLIMNDDEIYLFNLRMKDIRKIITIIFGETLGFDMDDYELIKSIDISGMEQQRTTLNFGGKYIYINSSKTPFEIKIWDSGFVSLENGMGSKIKFENALEIYDILLKRMK